MTVTDTTQLQYMILTKAIGSEILDSITNASIMRPLAYEQKVPPGAKGITFPMANVMAETKLVTNSTEATALTAVAFAPTEAVATIEQYEISVLVGKLADRTASPSYKVTLVREQIAQLTDAMDASLAGLLSGFSNTTGTTTNNVTIDDLDEAIVWLETNAKRYAAGAFFVMHPRLLGDLRQDSYDTTASSGISCAPIWGRADVMGFLNNGGEMRAGDAAWRAYRGHYAGYPIFCTPQVPSMNSGADYGSALISPKALGLGLGWDPEVEIASAAGSGISGTYYIANVAFGVVEVHNSLGVTIIGDL